MDIKEAVEKVTKAPVGDRAVTLLRAAREFPEDAERTQLHDAAMENGLTVNEIVASFAAADRD